MQASNRQSRTGDGPERPSRAWVILVLVQGAIGMGVALASPLPVGSSCSAGWDQLLPPGQRQQALQQRGCEAAAENRTALANQLVVYAVPVTDGPLGPLAAPRGRPVDAAPTRPDARSFARPASVRPTVSGRPRGGAKAARPVALASLIDDAARAHDIDPLLLHAIARIESRHDTRAISHAGAHGLMQVIVPTARRFGVSAAQQLHDPQTNLDVSARYLKLLQRRFGNDLTLVLAAYNAGEGAVEKHGRRIPPYRETQGYVRKVMSEYELLRRVSQRQAAPLLTRADLESML